LSKRSHVAVFLGFVEKQHLLPGGVQLPAYILYTSKVLSFIVKIKGAAKGGTLNACVLVMCIIL
jgi:hypothetical protein